MGTKKMPSEELFGGFSDPQIRPVILWGQKWTFFLLKISDLPTKTARRAKMEVIFALLHGGSEMATVSSRGVMTTLQHTAQYFT